MSKRGYKMRFTRVAWTITWKTFLTKKGRRLRKKFEAMTPTVPGRYLDKNGGAWTLTADGHWVDTNGNTGPRFLNWAVGPQNMRRVGDDAGGWLL